MFYTYVLFSPNHQKIYIGYTSDLDARFKSHNELATKGYTVKYRPGIILFAEEFTTKSDAMKREKSLKAGKGREEIWNIIKKRGLISARGWRQFESGHRN